MKATVGLAFAEEREKKKATHKGGGDVCRLNFQDTVREEERRCLFVQYDVSVGSGQYQMLQCSYAPAETLCY
jgi:hypothetical protein